MQLRVYRCRSSAHDAPTYHHTSNLEPRLKRRRRLRREALATWEGEGGALHPAAAPYAVTGLPTQRATAQDRSTQQ